MPIADNMLRLKAAMEEVRFWDHPFLTGQPVFERVETYRKKALAEAFQDLRIYKEHRVGLIVPTGLDIQEDKSHPALVRLTHTPTFSLLLADRDYGRRQSAVEGDDNTAGVIPMVDALFHPEHGVIGHQLGYDDRVLLPEGAEAFDLLKDEEDELTGRAAWAIHWRVQSTKTNNH